MTQLILVLCGALAGGVLGYFGFFWMAAQGFYALALPGGLLGLGAGIVKNRTILVAVSCALAATVLGLVAEWRYAPFIQDDRLAYFLTHVYQLNPVTFVMIVVGSLVAFWVPFRRMERNVHKGSIAK